MQGRFGRDKRGGMWQRWGVLLVALATVTAACGGTDDEAEVDVGLPTSTTSPTTTTVAPAGTTPGTTIDDEPPPSTAAPAGRDAPLAVEYSFDDANAVVATVGNAGGIVTATGADGTVFRLTVPEQALLTPEQLVMTPIAEVTGEPMDELLTVATAVRLEPEGLVLLQPATLEITPPDAHDDTIAFSTFGGGDEFHLVPRGAADGKTTLQIYHFSEYGSGEAGPTVGRMNFDAVVSGYEDTAQDAQAQTELAVIERRVTDPSAALEAGVEVFLYWGRALSTRLGSAGLSQDRLEQATGEMNWWFRQIHAYFDAAYARGASSSGSNTEDLAEVMNDVFEAWYMAVDVVVRRSHGRCVRDADPLQTFRMMRWVVIGHTWRLGNTDSSIMLAVPKELLDEWFTLAAECFAFRVVYRTKVEVDTSNVESETITSSNVLLKLDNDFWSALSSGHVRHPAVTGDITVESFTTSPALPCSIGSESGTLSLELQTRLNIVSERDLSTIEVEHIDVVTRIEKTIDLTGCGLPPQWSNSVWRAWLETANTQRSTGDDGATLFRVPLVNDGDQYALLELVEEPISVANGSANVTQLIQVIHEPQGG